MIHALDWSDAECEKIVSQCLQLGQTDNDDRLRNNEAASRTSLAVFPSLLTRERTRFQASLEHNYCLLSDKTMLFSITSFLLVSASN